jgi:GTP-binding protein
MFKDHAVVHVKAGDGGNGCVAYHREKYVPNGGPSGGDGGNGGSVYLVANFQESTLFQLVRKPHVRAENGVHGGGKKCHGRRGNPLELQVPIGTLVYDKETNALLRDLKADGDRVRVARGGNGGWGNARFATSLNQKPDRANPGQQGDQLSVRLELKLIADVGLVGLPNAGKSTLITRVSAATPRVANYPFTTLNPHPGIVELSGFRRFVMMDIPGLIEGASDGHGLGHQFLRHVERTRILVHMVDMAPLDDRTCVEAYHTIRGELEQYSPKLASTPNLVVLTKSDLVPDPAEVERVFTEETGVSCRSISAATGQGLDELMEALWRLLEQSKEEV